MSIREKMSTADLMESLREELTCFICLDYFRNPVTTECGHTFCLMCLLKSWEEYYIPVSCPECWRTLRAPHFQANKRLGRLASIGRQLRAQVLLRREDESSRPGGTLAATRSVSDDQQSVVSFSALQSHRVNRAQLPRDAEEQLKEKLQHVTSLLRKKKKDAQAVLTHEKERVILCMEETQMCKQVVVSEFLKMHQFLKEEEQLQLQVLEKEERENVKKLKDNELQLTQQVRHLNKMIDYIESTCQNLTLESFEEVRAAMDRCESLLLQCPETTVMELSPCRVIGMMEMLRKFSTEVTLDPATANAYLVLSEDLKSVRYGATRQQLPDNPERFNQSATVLGAQIFTCGRHYWEVEVGKKTEWEVGICKDSVSRKGNLPKLPGELFSIIGLKIGDDCSLWVSSPLKCQHIREPMHKVGVFLDYESGHIAFYNVTEESLIYSFPSTSFHEALRPIFSPCLPNEGTNIDPLVICSLKRHI